MSDFALFFDQSHLFEGNGSRSIEGNEAFKEGIFIEREECRTSESSLQFVEQRRRKFCTLGWQTQIIFFNEKKKDDL